MSRHLSQRGGQTQGRQAATWQRWWKTGKAKVSEKGSLGFDQHPKERDGKKKEEKLCYSDSALRKEEPAEPPGGFIRGGVECVQ